jgi:hypothetical protein
LLKAKPETSLNSPANVIIAQVHKVEDGILTSHNQHNVAILFQNIYGVLCVHMSIFFTGSERHWIVLIIELSTESWIQYHFRKPIARMFCLPGFKQVVQVFRGNPLNNAGSLPFGTSLAL